MDPDLRDLLTAWLGGDDPGEERREALVERLRTDAAFRQTFVDEVRMLGMLKAVQSAEPRWLRLEDVTGWSAPTLVAVETLADQVVQTGKGRVRARALIRWSWAAAAAMLIGAGALFLFRPDRLAGPLAVAPAPVELARVVRLDNVMWETGQASIPEGGAVPAGHLRLRSGRLSLAFGGVAVTVEGPADLELLSRDRVFCHLGKVRVRVPSGAEGFTVNAPGYEVVDLGTEFGLNLGTDGKSQLMVFKGEATVSVLGEGSHSLGSALIDRFRAVEIDPGAMRIRDVPLREEQFVRPVEPAPPALDLDPSYKKEVLAANPWGYWRFEQLLGGRVPNEVTGRPPLRPLGGVQLAAAGGNQWAVFRSRVPAQALLMDGEWVPPRERGYAIELWVQADPHLSSLASQSAVVSLIAAEDGPDENHVSLIELTARSGQSPHDPCAVRFLDRWPAALHGGSNVFSRRTFVPVGWHHVVGQKVGDILELYIDGDLVGTSPAPLNADGGDAAGPCRLLVGRLKLHPRNEPIEIRPFEGRIDELAVYERPLTVEEIRAHAVRGK